MDLKKLHESCTPEQFYEVFANYLEKDDMYREVFDIYDYIAELKECKCGNIEERDKMHDTEGKLDGGIGLICETCKGDM